MKLRTITHVHFADVDGWSPTAPWLAEDARGRSAELDQTGARSQVVAAHEVFVALNSRFSRDHKPADQAEGRGSVGGK